MTISLVRQDMQKKDVSLSRLKLKGMISIVVLLSEVFVSPHESTWLFSSWSPIYEFQQQCCKACDCSTPGAYRWDIFPKKGRYKSSSSY
jgi:hypothetical protein